MDPRVKTLIEGVRLTHKPLLWVRNDNRREYDLAPPDDPYCVGCVGVVRHRVCPALAAAKELEDESEESS